MRASGTRSGPEFRYLPIADHGAIGNLRTAALVGRNGSINWCCMPRFDSPSLFGAVLDARLGGHFAIAPEGGYRADQAYIPETNVLQTTFEAGEGRLRITDWIPVRGDLEGKGQEDVPAEICRLVECLAGRCEMVLEWAPRFDYARAETHVRLVSGGAIAESASDRSTLRRLRDGGEVVQSEGGPLLRLKLGLMEGERFAVASAWGDPGRRYTVDDAYACRDKP